MGKAVDTGILYTKDDNLYYYDLKNEPYQVQEGLSNGGTYHYFYTAWGASVTEDGSYLYFSDDVDENGAFVLYRRDAKNADAKAAQIDTDVYDYMASKDGKVVAYLKKSGETYALCVYDGKQVQTVKTGINLENDVYELIKKHSWIPVLTESDAEEAKKNIELSEMDDSRKMLLELDWKAQELYDIMGEN